MRLQFDPDLDYYEVLQVHPKAHPEIIKRAYRTLVAQLHAHPDLGGSHQQMVLINRAYEVLSDPELRAEYDRWRAGQAAGGAGRAQPAPASPPTEAPAPGIISAACPKCGRRNRVPQEVGLLRARCGACGERLMPGPQGERETSDARRQPAADRARVGAHRRLPQELYNELRREGQLRVQLQRVARGSRVVCRRCGQPWWAPHSGKPPRACPSCGSGEWLTFRLFKCSRCEHEFESGNLRAWPYVVHAACPSCGARNWNRAAERSPLRWIMPVLLRVTRGRTAR
jgi:DNA-directed RNA polymerase subunit RPC12/RpoP